MKKYVLNLLLFFCVIGVGFGQEPDWKWQNPLPTGNHLKDVFFINDQIGWSVGEEGTISRTINGGNTWTNQASGTTKLLYSIHFTDPQNGWVAGDAGIILKTTNGGNTWTTKNSGVSNQLFSVYFSDSQTGWVVGSSGTILKTTNGGGSWTNQVSGGFNALFGVHFIDNQTGWVVGGGTSNGIILKTTNGGSTWSLQNSGTTNQLVSNYFVDAQTGFSVGVSGTILKTINGGSTWTVQSSGTIFGLKSVHFVNTQTGWVVGSYGTILKTANGGTSWTSISGTTYYLDGVHFTDTLRGWVVGVSGKILKTNDGGNTWEDQRRGLTNTLGSIHFATSQNGWAVGNNGIILKTINAGMSWQIQNSGTTNYLYSVHFIDVHIGWAFGQNLILKTNNGGDTWQSQSLVGVGLFAGHFNDSLNGWAVGNEGIIQKTSNGGNTWQNQISSTTTPLYSIHFLDSLHGWVSGQGGTILKTNNGGNFWQIQTSGTTNPLRSVYFIDTLTGWSVGFGGVILKTINGGASWQIQESGTNQNLNSVHFLDNLNGSAVGENGTILKTIDGGNSWQSQISGTSNGLYSVYLKDPQNGWAVGVNGTILITNSGLNPGIPSSLIIGYITQNFSSNCNPNPSSPKLSGMVVKAIPGPYFGISDMHGKYQVRLPIDSHSVSNFSISALPAHSPAFHVVPVCPVGNAYSITLDSISDTLEGKDFSYQVTQCHHLDLQLASDRRRKCFKNTSGISYQNLGSLPAPNSYLLVEFPHWVRPLSASMSHIGINDSVWRFDLGTVLVGGGGYINIIDSVLCSAPINLTQCTKATIYPAPDCPPLSGWSGAEVSVSGICDQGVVHLGIYTNGSADMVDSVDYTVFLDSNLVRIGKVKLVTGDSLKMDVDAFGMTVTLSANQVANHPSEVFVSTTIEACDDTIVFYPRAGVNHFPKAQTANSKTHCLPIRASYDPNDKQAFPIGFTSNHVVKPGTQMEYMVRFQNTGNDTAFTAYVIDSLDNNLSPETLELGAASHPYEISMQTTRQGRTFLRWQFDQINLPDSNTNELKSHGFFQYRISPKAGLTFGSKARNEAAIYFDFNPPVLTNQTLTTFDNTTFTDPTLNDNVHVVVPTQTSLSAKQLGVKLYPNPVTQNQLTVSFQSKGSLTLFNAQGQVVYQKENLEGTHTLPVRLKSGIYIARISTEKGNSVEKVVVLE